MTYKLVAGASLLALGAAVQAASAQESAPALQDVIIVTGSRYDTATQTGIAPDASPLDGADITRLAARTPGGARLSNGELSGQMAYRGLSGERLNLRVDGQRFASGGPNLMDPVFHYAPAPLVSAVIIDRGVSPVSEGPGLAGGADAVFKRQDFTDGPGADFGYDLTASARSVNDGLSVGGMAGASTDRWRFNLLGAYEDASDTDYGDGTIGGSSFQRSVYGLSAGAKLGIGEVGLDLRRHEADPSGNPPFPMDIQYVDTDFAKLSYKADLDGVTVNASVNYTDVDHLMDNFSLRPSPAPMQTRATFTEATTRGAELSASFDWQGGELEIGTDTARAEHDAIITNPNMAAFFVTPFPDVTIDRTGAFAQWTGTIGPVESELGVRADWHDHDAGDASLATMLPPPAQMLAAVFNASDRSTQDTTVDAVARIWTPERNGLSWRATLARKQAMPGYIQRFGWLPISASGGLADGNIYVGDLGVDPETALIAEAGFDYAAPALYARPTVYVRQIDDYIQGVLYDSSPGIADTPVEMIASMNGDPTPLRWANVDARLYGFDLDAGYDFDGPLRLDGVLSYVRGERRDIDDNLYRIAPASLTLDLTWEADSWSATFETRAAAEQDKVSATNEEAATPGYVVLNLYGDWQVKDGVTVSAGIENLLDHVYRDHLAGYNRNGFGDVAIGTRVPGAGRGAFIRLSLKG